MIIWNISISWFIYSVDSGQSRCINYNPDSYYLTFKQNSNVWPFRELHQVVLGAMHDTWCSSVTCSQPANQRPDCRQLTNQRQGNWPADRLERGAEAARRPSKEHVCLSVGSLVNAMQCPCCDWLQTSQWYGCGQVPSLGIGWPKLNESDIQIFHTNGNIYLS